MGCEGYTYIENEAVRGEQQAVARFQSLVTRVDSCQFLAFEQYEHRLKEHSHFQSYETIVGISRHKRYKYSLTSLLGHHSLKTNQPTYTQYEIRKSSQILEKSTIHHLTFFRLLLFLPALPWPPLVIAKTTSFLKAKVESIASLNVAKFVKLTLVKIGRFSTVKANVDFAPFAMPLPNPSSKDADTARMELTIVFTLVTKENNCAELAIDLVILLRI